MQNEKTKYTDFLLKTKGVSVKYADVVSIHINKAIKFLEMESLRDVRQVTRKHLDKFQKQIMSDETYASGTKKDILTAVSLFFEYLYNYEVIKDNPGLIIELPKNGKRIPRNIMNEEEIAFLFTLPDQNDLYGLRDLCIMSLLYGSAMRPKELFNLKLDDVDLKNNQALIKRPKNRRDRIVHFDRYTSFYLKKYLNKIRPLLSKNPLSNNFFVSATGSDLKKGSWAVYFSKKYKPIMDEKFNKHITPYVFRHTSATHWLDSAAKQKRDVLPFIQRQLGHESLESTAIYTHVAIEPLRQMFRMYHPREISLKAQHRIPSPDEIISKLKDPKDPPQDPPQPPA